MKNSYKYLATFISYNAQNKEFFASDMYRDNLGNHRFIEYEEEEVKNILENKENIITALKQGNVIQLTQELYNIKALIGTIKREEPYGEISYFEVIDEETNDSLSLLLQELNNRLNNTKSPIKKLYKQALGGIYE